jgi:PHD/YefM family antitoxin component YafN of YafNO toxin-antitoxin module
MIAITYAQLRQETDYLLGNPANAEHLRESIRQLDAGLVEEHELVDLTSAKAT